MHCKEGFWIVRAEGWVMSLFAIGDLHLSILSETRRMRFLGKHYDLYKPMDVFDPVWKNHADRIERYWKRRIREDDVVVVTGDHSWGKNLDECRRDFAYIEALPGRKILLRGNHDMFWEVKHTEWLNREFADRLFFLQNNYAVYGDYALVGTKGYSYDPTDDSWEHFVKIRDRELGRLRVSFEKARLAGYRKYVMFLHYPPTSIGEEESCFTRLAREYGVKQVVYSHCHGEKRYYDSLHGTVDGISYLLVSSDFLCFKPKMILP